jgi:hypothetical protein
MLLKRNVVDTRCFNFFTNFILLLSFQEEFSEIFLRTSLLFQSTLQHVVGFWPAQLSLSILSRKVLQSAVARGTSNPQHGRHVTNQYMLLCEVPDILSGVCQTSNFSTYFHRSHKIAWSVRRDNRFGQTGVQGERRADVAKLIFAFHKFADAPETGNKSQSKFYPVLAHCKILRPFGSCTTMLTLQSSMYCWLCVGNSCLPYGSQNKQQFLPVQN